MTIALDDYGTAPMFDLSDDPNPPRVPDTPRCPDCDCDPARCRWPFGDCGDVGQPCETCEHGCQLDDCPTCPQARPTEPAPEPRHDDTTCPSWCVAGPPGPAPAAAHAGDWYGATLDDGRAALARAEITTDGPVVALAVRTSDGTELVVKLPAQDAYEVSAALTGAGDEANEVNL